MNTIVFNCGCSITRSMFDDGKIVEVEACFWHYYLYDEDKTPKQLAKDINEIDRSENNCYDLVHFYFRVGMGYRGSTRTKEICSNCKHHVTDGVYAENNSGWIPNKKETE